MIRQTITPRSKAMVVLPLPPSTNNLFATVVKGGKPIRVKTREYKAWLKEVAPLLVELKPPKALPVEVFVHVTGRVNLKRDGDNLLKPFGDALVAGGLIPDDCFECVAGWTVKVQPSAEEPAAMVWFCREGIFAK